MIFNPRMKPRLGTPLNKSHRLARGLVGCWLMNEGGGSQLFDLSGNHNTGTINVGWTSPTGYSDPDSQWTDEAKVYDGDTGTYVYNLTYNHYLELTLTSPILCDKIRIHIGSLTTPGAVEEIDVYYGEDWHNIYSGTLAEESYVEISIGTTQTVSKARIIQTTAGNSLYINEFGFHQASLWTPGKFGSALDLDGSDDYISVGDDNSLDINSAITILALIEPDTYGYEYTAGRRYGRIVRKGTNFNFTILDDSENLDEGIIFDGTTGQIKSTANAIDLNVKQHVAVTFDGSNGKIYINGTLNNSGDGGTLVANADALIIGNYDAGTTPRYFDGLIEYVMIWNRALLASEIQQLYCEPFCMFGRELIWGESAAPSVKPWWYYQQMMRSVA